MTLGPGTGPRRARLTTAGRRVAGMLCSLPCLVGCCGGLTGILPVTRADVQQTTVDCERVFPRGAFEVTSVVEASIPLSDDISLIGVVVAHANGREFRSLLLTQEGLVVFDVVRRGERITVLRALPPIDPEGFGRQMTDDVRLILMHPEGQLAEVGRTQSGTRICRWSGGEEQVEVWLMAAREARIRRFQQGILVRDARLREIGDDGFARDILLETTSLVGYRLHLMLQTVDR